MLPIARSLVLVPLVLIGCERRQVCILMGDDCCPNETVAAAEADLGMSTGDAFRAWRDLTFEGQSDDGPQIVSIALTRRTTQSEGYQPAGPYPPAGASMESICDVGLEFEVGATAAIGSDEVRGLAGYLRVEDDTTLLLMNREDPGCGCAYRIDAVLDTGPESEQVVGGSFEVDCTAEDWCLTEDDDPDFAFGEEVVVAW